MIYANGLKISINEIVKLEFIDNNVDVTAVVLTYDVFKQLYQGLGQTIENHDAHLARQVDAKNKAN